MRVSSIILGRPWLYDHDAILYGRFNSCSFNHHGKKLVINPTPPKDHIKRESSNLKEKKLGLNMISAKELEREITEGSPVWILTTKKTHDQTQKEHPQKVVEFLKELEFLKDFQDVFPKELPDQLSPLRDIQHTIDIV